MAKVHKVFKKTLLTLCQAQFDDTANNDEPASEIASTVAGAMLIKKKYIGLMAFLGELYGFDTIKAEIMISCLERLFVKVDEEKLECFAKLMTSVGYKLDHEKGSDDHDHLAHIWEDVYSMADRAKSSKE